MTRERRCQVVKKIRTNGGALVGGNIQTNGGTFVGRDLTILQQEVQFSELDRMAEERPLDALRSYLALRNEANGRSRYFRTRLESLQQHLAEQMPRLIFDLGEMLQANDLEPARGLTNLLQRFWNQDPTWNSVFETIKNLMQSTPGELNGETIIQQFKEIFKKYQQSSVLLLEYLVTTALNTTIRDELAKELEKQDDLRISIPAVGKLKRDSYPQYNPLSATHKPAPAQVTAWTNANTPNFYPFLLDCAPPAEIIAFPKHWDELPPLDQRQCILSDSIEDLRIFSSALRMEWQNKKPAPWIVPVHLPGTLTPPVPWQILLGALADTWTRFLAHNPQAPYHLGDTERLRLALLIQWHYPDLSTFGRGMALLHSDEANQQALMRSINRLLKNTTQPEQLIVKFLDDFLTLRPAGIEETIFLIEGLDPPSPERDTLLRSLIGIAEDHRLYFKVLVRERLSLTTLTSIRLYWETETLQNYLNERLQRAGAPGGFDSFFDPPIRASDTLLAHLADGSLARLLRLAHRLVQHALQAGRDTLTPTDLNWLQNQYTDRDPLREGGAL